MTLVEPRGARHSRCAARRARPDGTAWLSLGLALLFLPPAALCLAPAAYALRAVLGLPVWCAYAVWAGSAACVLLRPAQALVARLLWPIRRPAGAERERLERVWRGVTARAGVPGRRFRILVADLTEVNAHSVGRDLICVTGGALDELGDRELAGVLAHELGHHLRMHSSAAAVLVWALLPFQGVALAGALLAAPFSLFARRLGAYPNGAACNCGRRSSAAPRPRSLSSPGLRREPTGRLHAACSHGSRPEFGTHPSRAALSAAALAKGIRTLFAAPGALAFAAKNAAGRRAEYRVDAFAVDIGLGPELLGALRWFAGAGQSVGCGHGGGIPAARAGRVEPTGWILPGQRTAEGKARHAAARVPRPTHPPLAHRMARIAARSRVSTPEW